MNNPYTVIYFDYGGHYSDNGVDESVQWVSVQHQIYAIVMKTSMEEVTFSELFDRICKKIGMDKTTTKLKFSYIPPTIEPRRLAYVMDDEDVLCFLLDVDKEQRRSLLHVEIIEEVEQNLYFEHNRGTEVLVKGTDDVTDFSHVQDLEELSCQELDVDISENVEVTPGDNVREDGIDIVLGQEFGSKQAVQDLIDEASFQNCFEVAIIKSSPNLYVVKCNQLKDGCKWSLRVAKVKDSDSFSVRTHNKMHTCTRVTASTRTKRRSCTPQLVASILHENYAGQFDIPNPKRVVDLVQEKLGIKVSYATALRGRKMAVKEKSLQDRVPIKNQEEESHLEEQEIT